MKKDQDEILDDLFRKELSDPVNDIGYIESDWNNLEQLLDARKKRAGVIYWLPVLSGIAAALLLFMGWWFFKPEADKTNLPKQQAKIRVQQKSPGTSGGAIQQPTESKQNISSSDSYAKNLSPSKHSLKGKTFFTLPAVGGRRDTTGFKNETHGAIEQSMSLAAVSKVEIEKADKIPAPDLQPDSIITTNKEPVNIESDAKKIKSAAQTKQSGKTQFALSVIASPDINGVNSFQRAKVGGNFGLLFSAGVSKKLTISTGAVYAIKPYLTAFQNYHTNYTFTQNPNNVTADCRVLDIPINLDYQLFNKNKNKISVGSGLSSYFMLSENYKFSYDENPYNYGPVSYKVINKNKHILGVLNLEATFQHQLNSKMGLIVQPYMKLPLTNIGASQVRLKSTGVAVGLNWNLNSSKKP